MSSVAEACVAGFDLNASRVRAVAGPPGDPTALALDGSHPDLPLALSLEGETAEVGRPGVRLCRRLPHLCCTNFLPHLDKPRAWGSGTTRLDAAEALALVLETLQPACAALDGLTLAVPPYLTAPQVALVLELAAEAGLPVAGAVASPLAAALAAHAEQPWREAALVLDADEHALTAAVVVAQEGWARAAHVRSLPQLGRQVWKERLLAAVADRCIRQSRRDPRDSAQAEQALYEQLVSAVEAARDGRVAELVIETPHWYQNVLLRPEELAAFCAPLVRQALDVLAALRSETGLRGGLGPVLVTASAARMPGLLAALEDRPRGASGPPGAGGPDRSMVQVLSAEAPARAAHALAAAACRGEVPAGHLEAAPLPPPRPADAGPARLHFRGQDHVLRGRPFLLGHHPTCDLVFDSARYPVVAARHCEVAYEGRTYVIRDWGSQAVWVNGRPVVQQLPLQPGDWIRLGCSGPVLRFMGRPIALAGSPRPAVSG
jgi:hypothetical protein